MKQYRTASHSVYDLKYRIVWITKYRKPVLNKEIGAKVRDLVRMICASLDVEIVKGRVSRDHVHILVSVPPTLSVSKLVQRMKGLTSRRLLQEDRGLKKAFWGRHLWGRGYYVASVGNVSEAMIAAYMENQQAMERTEDADLKVEPLCQPQSALADRRQPPAFRRGWFSLLVASGGHGVNRSAKQTAVILSNRWSRPPDGRQGSEAGSR